MIPVKSWQEIRWQEIKKQSWQEIKKQFEIFEEKTIFEKKLRTFWRKF
jgi:hypothetical protein